jgi:Glycosyltransferase family 28 C-terminal domain
VNGSPSHASHVLLVTSNGTGMGHLARQAAVALVLPAPFEPVLFSLSQAVHLVARHGIRAEYCPSHRRGWMPALAWHSYLRARLGAVLEETSARVVVFDGVAPYPGLLRARADYLDTPFVWVRRGMWRPGVNGRALAFQPFFDLVLEPGDLAAAADRGATARRGAAVRVPPITVQEAIEPLPRAEAVAALGLDPARRTLLVALGVGGINDTATPAAAVLRAVESTPGWQAVVVAGSRSGAARTSRAASATAPGAPVRSAEAAPGQLVRELVDVYPLARYLSAFDAAVSAAGYNAVHELLHARVPTALVPNLATGIDDQVARAEALAAAGLALSADERSSQSLTSAVHRVLDPNVRASLSRECARLPSPTGAAETAERLRELDASFVGHRMSIAERALLAMFEVKRAAGRVLGPGALTLVRSGRRRPARSAPAKPLEVRPVVTNELDPDVLHGGHPVEHVLPDSSPRYLARRLALAYTHYNWTADSAAPTTG